MPARLSLGVGYRQPLGDWLATTPPEVGCLEITAEHFFDGGERTLRSLSKMYPLFVHGLGLSLGTPGRLHQPTLKQFVRVAQAANAEWVSEHVAFTRTGEVDLGHLNPVPRTRESLRVITEHALEVAESCGKPLILENITAGLQVGGCFSETEFLNRLCEDAQCGLLLDVTNLFINGKNHGYDPAAWLHELDPRHIVQLHVVGYSKRGDEYHDHHSAPIQPEIMELVQAAVEYAPVKGIILERDERLEEVDEIASELRRLAKALENHRFHDSAGTPAQ